MVRAEPEQLTQPQTGSASGACKRVGRPKDVCQLMRISRTTLWRLAKDPLFPQPFRLGKCRATLFDLDAVDQYLDRCKNRS